MRLLCESNTGISLADDVRLRSETDRTEFSPLRLGSEYLVYGLMFRARRVDFLVCPDSAGPCWMPSDLFKVLDPTIPPWRTCLIRQTQGYRGLLEAFGITALIGYDALVSDYEHYEGILERDSVHLQAFFSEKMIMDRWHMD
jgi:hypothetical protein